MPAPAPTAPAPAPPARKATWKDVSRAARDSKTKAALDIDWIDGLPEHLRNTIDVQFADDRTEKQLAATAKRDRELINLDRELVPPAP